MRALKWLEEKLFTGEVLHDYGPIHRTGTGLAGETHTLLLCRRGGKEWITFRHSYRAMLGFSVRYTALPLDLARPLTEKLADMTARSEGRRPA